MIFRRKKERTLTSVSTVLSASHRDQVTGQVHGHTWRIRASFHFNGTDQKIYRCRLDEAVKPYDHTCLPDRIAWGEPLARHIYDALCCGYESTLSDVVRVQVIRTEEDIWAEYEHDQRGPERHRPKKPKV